MYICKHFDIFELVPEEIFKGRGQKAWELLDDRLLITIDALRGHLGAAIINDYQFGGRRQWSGLRTPDSPWYSPTSQHSFGRAVDIIFKDIAAEEARKEIIRQREKMFPYITAMELNVSWVHIDVRNHKPLKLFAP